MALLIIVISAVTFVVWAIHEGTKNARNFNQVLDKPEETVKEDEHANNIGI